MLGVQKPPNISLEHMALALHCRPPAFSMLVPTLSSALGGIMKKRLLISLLFALFLPFPGPHIDTYIPLVGLPLKNDFWKADWFFRALFCVLLIFYWIISFAMITAITYLKKIYIIRDTPVFLELDNRYNLGIIIISHGI
jgi:hypothetical protein